MAFFTKVNFTKLRAIILIIHFRTFRMLFLKIVAIALSLCAISFLVYGTSAVNLTVYAQSDLQTIKYRNLVIDLGNGVKTNAQLTIPAIGNGPFPGVLLITGSGAEDMNSSAIFIHIDNTTGTK